MKHKLLNKNESSKTAWCIACNSEVEIQFNKRKNRAGSWRCAPAHKLHNAKHRRPNNYKYRFAVKSSCEFCGFIPVEMCQLDVDHIDGNHNNNDISNLQTLCANCHRLKTFLQTRSNK